ncbi:DUF6585 family protein [Pseudonocardia acaciae]|uniref:DUF6585 family protein n=1 Tax=Pseudonocardia acaciae TaxID=551276 RepID=UPI00048E67F0|nr:DUF6585 family protein [Pseudonocardia acaciae]
MTTPPVEDARLRRRAEAGEVRAMSRLGYRLHQRWSTRPEALAWWERAAWAGDIYAMQQLAAHSAPEDTHRWQALLDVTRRGPRTHQVPPEVRNLAAGAALGAHRATFGDHPPTPNHRPPLLAALRARLRGQPIRTPPTWVFALGLIQQDDATGGLIVFPWRHTRLTRHITRDPRTTATTYTYRLTRDDGTHLTLTGTSTTGPEVWVLGEQIARAITSLQLPHAASALHTGHRLTFGPLAIDLHGIHHGPHTLPWRDLTALTIHNGQLHLAPTTTRTPTSAIPDLDILLTLATALHEATHLTSSANK